MDQLETFRQGDTRTGINFEEDESILVYPFDKYQIEVKLTLDGKFLGITGISVSSDFLSFVQKLNSIGYIDTDDQYPPD